MPKVSVIMPVHNEPELYLRTAINSILNQTFKDFEFIIINDASENNAEDVILSYKDERIRYYKNEKNLKVIKTLNKGLSLATGEYIARMDADDISYKKRLEMQVDILDNNENIGLVNSQCYIFPDKRKIEPPIYHYDIEKTLKYSVNCIVHPVVMLRKSVIEEHGLKYSENYLHIEDYKLWIDLCNVTQLYTIPEPLVSHRDWGASISRQNDWEQYYNAKNLVFESILKDVGYESSELKSVFNAYLHGESISKKDYLEIDEILCKILKLAYNSMTPYWFNYIFAQIHDMRNQLHSKVM